MSTATIKALIPIDPDEVAVVGCDWGNWLASIGASALDDSSFSLSSGKLAKGDGVTEITKAGETVTPPVPTISQAGIASAHVWCTDLARLGDEVVVINTVRVGSRVKQKTIKLIVQEE